MNNIIFWLLAITAQAIVGCVIGIGLFFLFVSVWRWVTGDSDE